MYRPVVKSQRLVTIRNTPIKFTINFLEGFRYFKLIFQTILLKAEQINADNFNY